MNNFKTVFTIKDLENISGIKAHTIRIWEKRYGLLHPKRTETNIRYYSSESLLKLLNVVFLNEHKFKISKIAQMSDEEIISNARELAFETATEHDAINSFKLAMFQFDKNLFNKTYNKLSQEKSFKEIFTEIFIPLLQHISLLWQTRTMLPAHEHFICNLITQKIYINTEKITNHQKDEEYIYVLFLPNNEIHGINLLYLNYELLSRGSQTIYLGKSLPLDNIDYFLNNDDKICFITSLTYKPFEEEIDSYLHKFDKIINNTDSKLIAFGENTKTIKNKKFTSDIIIFNSLQEVLNVL